MVDRAWGKAGRRRARRWLPAGAAVLMALVPAQVLTPRNAEAAVTAPETCAAQELSAGSAGAATALARACGKRVVVTDAVSETAQTFAEPSGALTLEQSAVPVRVRRGSGWVAVDPTLVRQADGTVVPKATTVDLRLSGGGSGALARLGLGAGSLSMTWPAALPAPVLSGDTAVYPGVYPGVDLQVRATATGFSHVLVVKSRAAAANPLLRTVHFGLSGSGVAVRQQADGGIEAVAPDGTRLAASGTATMWDSGKPGDLATPVAVPMRLSGGDLALTPDAAMLASPDTSFPLYVDPSWSATRWRWAYADSQNKDNNDGVARVGASPDGYGGAYRSFFNYDLLPLGGKHILDATFRTKLTHSWSCANSPVSLYFTGAIASGVNGTRTGWSPGLIRWLDEKSGHAHKGSDACGNQPDMTMEFNNLLAGQVRDWVNAGGTDITVGLSVANRSESDVTLWKKFSPSDSFLVITYNSIPNVPDQLDTYNQGCTTGSGRPVVATGQPVLKARLTDPDVETNMHADFSVQQYDAAHNTWPGVWTTRTAAISSGATAQVTVGTVLAPGIYRWQALASDPYDTSRSWSQYCEFEVDTVRPNTAVVSADPANTPFSSGKTIRLTLSPGGSPPDTDVTGYNWWVVDGQGTHPTAFAAGATATIDWTPIPGQGTIYVAAKDRVQTSAVTAQYAFNAAQPSTEVARWSLAEPSGSTSLADGTGGGHTATLTGGGITGSAGRIVHGDKVMALDGGSGAAATTGPVVDTSRNFTVSAWVKLTRADGFKTVLAADGTRNSSFYLQYVADVNRWSFTVPKVDADGWTAIRTVSTSVPALGVWTELTGVYDSVSGTIRLYVNGVLEGQVSGAHVFAAAGPFTIGRGKNVGTLSDYWPGSVYDVRVWNRALSDAEILAIVDLSTQFNMTRDTTGQWLFDEGNGTVAHDSSVYYNDLTINLDPSAAWTGNGHSGSALLLDGTGGAQTDDPVLYTDQSFTVSAWVKMTGSTLPTTARTVASQDGTSMSGFYLSYRLINSRPLWCFSIVAADSPTGKWANACTKDALTTSMLNTWVHLGGVYDASTGKLSLYVDGQRADDGTGVVTGRWTATGPLAIGRALWTPPSGGTTKQTDYWVGVIDDVTVTVGTDPRLAIAQ